MAQWLRQRWGGWPGGRPAGFRVFVVALGVICLLSAHDLLMALAEPVTAAPSAHQANDHHARSAEAAGSGPTDHPAACGAVQEAVPSQGSTAADGPIGANAGGEWHPVSAAWCPVQRQGLAVPLLPPRAMFQVWRL